MSSASAARPAHGALPIRTKEKKHPTKPAAAKVAPKPNAAENADSAINSAVSAAEGQVATTSGPNPQTQRKKDRKKKVKALQKDGEWKKPEDRPLPESTAKSRKTKPRAEKKSVNDQAENIEGGIVVEKRDGAPLWKLSPFLGGRYASLDPVFTRNEKYASSIPSSTTLLTVHRRHLLVAQALSLKVYSVKTSLLVRAISLPATTPTERIISYFLDPRTDDRAYVASNSWLYLYNLTNGERVHRWRLDEREKVRQVCACADQELKPSESEVVYVVTKSNDDSLLWRVGLFEDKVEKVQIFRGRGNITAVHPADAGRAVCLIIGKDLVVLNFEETKWQAPRVFKMAESLTCMDVLKVGSGNTKKSKKGAAQRGGDVVVGDSSGAMYVLHGVVTSRAEVTPRKMHWHRMAVQSVKWALDGEHSCLYNVDFRNC
jgi:NET1-associated nuclear protein 1 (U3 small nucleolar RNA-associated protein 17)